MADDEPFVIDEDDRYARLRLIAWWDQEKLANARIMVVGAGALGNEVLKNLALLGIGHIDIVDFDEVEQSNLTRSVLFRSRDRGRPKAEAAAAALRDMNPDTGVRAMPCNIITDVGLGTFRDADVVIGCLDNREARLWVNRCCWKVGTPWIDGGIQEINGVAKVFCPPDGACYECAMTEMDYKLINLRYSCPLLRQEDLQAGKVPTAPTISSMIGGLQTQEALKLIHGMDVASGEAMVYNGVANQFYRTAFQRREDCLSHESYPTPVETEHAASRTTAEQLFGEAVERFGPGPWRLSLDRDLVVSLECGNSGHQTAVLRAMQSVGMQDAACPSCGKDARPNFAHSIETGSDLAGETLSTLGVPPYDIVKLENGSQEQFLLLAGDRTLNS